MSSYLYALSLMLGTAFYAAAEPAAEQALAESEMRLDDLQRKMQEEVEKNNALRAKIAAQSGREAEVSAVAAPTLVSEPKEPLLTAEQRLAAVEEKLKIVEAKLHQQSTGARTEAEAKATKEAQESAPPLASATPALAQYNQAFALFNQNELDKAREAFQSIVEKFPDDAYTAKSWYHLGEIQYKKANYEGAEMAYRKALTSKLEVSTRIECLLSLTETLVRRNNNAQACEQLTLLKKEDLTDIQKKRMQALTVACQPAEAAPSAVPAVAPSPVVAPEAPKATKTAPAKQEGGKKK